MDGNHMNENELSVNGSPDGLDNINMDPREGNLAELKKRRKEIERDAQLLANRIALLKQEEMKTWKKIEETKKRTGEIQNLKKRNEDKVQKRQEEKRKIQEAIFLSKKEEAKQTKMIKQQNEQKKRHLLMKIENDNKQKNELIVQQKRIAQLKIEEDKRRRVQSVKRDIDNKFDNEARIRAMKEQEVMQMEMLEMELIKKLQNTQAIQKEAYAELEKALSQPSKMIGSYLMKNIIPSTKGKYNGNSEQSQDQSKVL